MSDQPRILILGGGFAGLVAAQTLKHASARITLLDKRNFHLFQPLLYQVATGSLSPGEIAAPLRAVLSRQKNVEVFLGEAADLDPAAKTVSLRDGAFLSYDYLLVATGSQTSYFGHNQWRDVAPSLKTIEEATTIRHKLLYAFESAERAATEAEARAWLTFVIVGAGPTGLELAGAIAEIARETLRHDFRHIRPEEARIILIEGGPRVLASYPEDLSAKAEQLVARLGVEVRKNAFVTNINADGLDFKHADTTAHLVAKNVIWTGGVDVTAFGRLVAERTHAPTDRSGKIKVNPDLTVPGFPEIFIAGDLAHIAPVAKAQSSCPAAVSSTQPVAWASLDQAPLPGVAQVAIQSGHYTAKVILAHLANRPAPLPFQYFNKGDMAVIGRAAAVANIFGVHVSGFFAWFVWLFIHLMYIVEFQSRVQVFIQWGFQYLTFSRGARLITSSTTGPHDQPS